MKIIKNKPRTKMHEDCLHFLLVIYVENYVALDYFI